MSTGKAGSCIQQSLPLSVFGMEDVFCPALYLICPPPYCLCAGGAGDQFESAMKRRGVRLAKRIAVHLKNHVKFGQEIANQMTSAVVISFVAIKIANSCIQV